MSLDPITEISRRNDHSYQTPSPNQRVISTITESFLSLAGSLRSELRSDHTGRLHPNGSWVKAPTKDSCTALRASVGWPLVFTPQPRTHAAPPHFSRNSCLHREGSWQRASEQSGWKRRALGEGGHEERCGTGSPPGGAGPQPHKPPEQPPDPTPPETGAPKT